MLCRLWHKIKQGEHYMTMYKLVKEGKLNSTLKSQFWDPQIYSVVGISAL